MKVFCQKNIDLNKSGSSKLFCLLLQEVVMSLKSVSFSKQTYELELLTEAQRTQIKTLTDQLYSGPTAELAHALISAEKEYSRCKDNIAQLAIAIEKSEIEFNNIISELTTFRTQITGKNNTLETEKGIADLIKNLSGPIAVGIFVFGVTGPAGAAAAAFSRFFGSSVGSTLESAKRKPEEDNNNNNAPAPAATQFTFRNVEKAWYKSCLSLVKDPKEPKLIVATLLRVLDTNDAVEFDLQIICKKHWKKLTKKKIV